MSHMLVKTMEMKGEDVHAECDHDTLEITEVTNDGIVEIALDITPRTDQLYIRLQLHELVRLAMLEPQSGKE